MNDIDTQIATLLDDVATTINPTPNFDAVLTGGGGGGGSVTGGSAGGGGKPFRRIVAIAAATVVVLGGAAAAFQLDGDDAGMVATETVTEPSSTLDTPTTTALAVSDGSASEPTTPAADEQDDAAITDTAFETDAEAEIEYSAHLGEGELGGDPVIQVVLGTTAPGALVEVNTEYGDAAVEAGEDGHWKAVLELHDVPAATLVPIRVSFAGTDEVVELTIHTPAGEEPDPPATTVAKEPAPETTEPKPQPDPVEFTAKLGASYNEAQPMKQVLYGTATPGTRILATSAYGHVVVYAGEKGQWEAHLKMYEVPGGTNVRITVTAGGFPQEFEFWVERPAPEPPKQIAFTAEVAAKYPEAAPMKMVLHGRGTPGSEVRAGSEYGVAEVRVGDGGYWEAHLKMYEVPAGTTVGVRVTNTKSEKVYEFSITKSGTPDVSHELTAEAAFFECDSTPPFNEYWGTGTPGATISISSPYGGKQVTVSEKGKWEARVEFPEAPFGEVFEVTITSSKDDGSVSLGFKRVEPG